MSLWWEQHIASELLAYHNLYIDKNYIKYSIAVILEVKFHYKKAFYKIINIRKHFTNL